MSRGSFDELLGVGSRKLTRDVPIDEVVADLFDEISPGGDDAPVEADTKARADIQGDKGGDEPVDRETPQERDIPQERDTPLKHESFEAPMTLKLISSLEEQIVYLKEQLKTKDGQLKTKDELLRNFQVLIRNDQDKILKLESMLEKACTIDGEGDGAASGRESGAKTRLKDEPGHDDGAHHRDDASRGARDANQGAAEKEVKREVKKEVGLIGRLFGIR